MTVRSCGVVGAVGDGVTDTLLFPVGTLAASPVPAAFLALTDTEYTVEFLSPVMV